MNTQMTDVDQCKFCSYEKMTELKIAPNDQGAFQVYCEYVQQHEDQSSKEEFEECYRGEFKSGGEFCEELFSSCDDSYNALNETLQKCIDWEMVWNYSVQYDYLFEEGYIFS